MTKVNKTVEKVGLTHIGLSFAAAVESERVENCESDPEPSERSGFAARSVGSSVNTWAGSGELLH